MWSAVLPFCVGTICEEQQCHQPMMLWTIMTDTPTFKVRALALTWAPISCCKTSTSPDSAASCSDVCPPCTVNCRPHCLIKACSHVYNMYNNVFTMNLILGAMHTMHICYVICTFALTCGCLLSGGGAPFEAKIWRGEISISTWYTLWCCRQPHTYWMLYISLASLSNLPV